MRTATKKRAVIGIGTLIVFIAMVLVAAVAAGVIIRTSGILQERAFAVAGEARKRLVTGIEVLQVVGTANVSSASIPDLEFFIRTRPGSRPVQLMTTGITFSTQDFAFSAELQHSLTEAFNDEIEEVLNETWIVFEYDMNRDYLPDTFRVINKSYGGVDDVAVLQFNLSGVEGLAEISLDINLSSSEEKNISINERKITYDDLVYGFVTINGNVSTQGYLNTSSDQLYMNVRQFPEVNVCNFRNLLPENFFCYESRLGDSDSVLELGELYILRYKLRDRNALPEEKVFQVNLMPRDGSVTFLESAPPSVISDVKVQLWPA